jgi:hypothetical protein
MHPLILQQLVTDRVNDITATAAGSRRAREARRTGGHERPGKGRSPACRVPSPSSSLQLRLPGLRADDTGASWASRPAWARLAQPSLSSIRRRP